jgi:integrase
MQLHRLTAKAVASARPGKYEDGGGLRLVVSPAGAKKWVLRITIHGKRRELGLGSYPTITLAAARQKAAHLRGEVEAGRDPRGPRPRVLTFTHCAAQYIRAHRRGWRSRKHAWQWINTLRTYVCPLLGETPIERIDTEAILQVLMPIWPTKTETAKRVQGRLENILDFATARRWRSGENPARWRGHLDKLLARPRRIRRVVHYPAMPYAEIPTFFRELRQNPGIQAYALQFLLLTVCRTTEVLEAQWGELDLVPGVWVIPAHRTKAHREHRVPLSQPAQQLLRDLPRLRDTPYVFPGARYRRPISNMSLLQLMRDMGYNAGGTRGHCVPHGFRSSFRDWASEQTMAPHAVMEAVLAHVVSDTTVSAYFRSDLFERRRELLTQWAAFLCTE